MLFIPSANTFGFREDVGNHLEIFYEGADVLVLVLSLAIAIKGFLLWVQLLRLAGCTSR